jgi:diguanylate cyclase (GGDEF)-like protein
MHDRLRFQSRLPRRLAALALAAWLAGQAGAMAAPGLAAASPAQANAALTERIELLGEQGRFAPSAALSALRKIEAAARAAPVDVQVRFLYHLSQIERGSGDTSAATALADELIALATATKDTDALARGLLAKAAILSELKQLSASHTLVRRAEQLAASSANIALRVDAGVASGQADAQQGDFPAALTHIEGAASLARQHEQTIGQIVALDALSRLYDQIKEYDKGFATLDEAYAIADVAGMPGHVALLKNSEYGLSMDTGQQRRAVAALRAGLALERKIGAAPMVVSSLVNLSDLALKDKQYASAIDYARSAIDAAQALGSKYREAVARFNLGAAQLGIGQLGDGKKSMDAALAVFDSQGDVPAMQSAWKEYGDYLEAAGDAPAALRAYHRERALSDELFKTQRKEALWQLEERFGAEKKARQIEQLHQENALKSAQIDNNRLQQKVWWLLATALTFGAIITAFLYRNVRRANAHLKLSNIELQHQSSHDPLTALYNRRYFHDTMSAHASAGTFAGAGGSAVADAGALFLIDVDHFKHVNDVHGHGVGDQVLVMIATQLREILRETDMIVRWGGEEFLAWLPELKRSRLNEVAARLLAGIAARPLVHQGVPIPVTVSIGYAPFPIPTTTSGAGATIGWERMLHLVDMALYMAKSHGRNRAYGLASIISTDHADLAALDAGLEQAWRDGAVDMAVVVGR